ncbi:MAG: hypothetical protein HOW73_27310 [Polyangiaceae bacterium]|nr:hypothetical protein [Polyangiaceae bacterium]
MNSKLIWASLSSAALLAGLTLCFGCDKAPEEKAAIDKGGPACFKTLREKEDERWRELESLVTDSSVCMFNRDAETLSMRSFYEASLTVEGIAQRFTAHFQKDGWKMEDHSQKPGVISRSYEKDGKRMLVVSHLTDDKKQVDNTIFAYK